ncbi:MAG: hypothetical protein HC804_02465 [Anaerolineae bacterium]|nr:hypothetical protein [Anaerolineae bacterium]
MSEDIIVIEEENGELETAVLETAVSPTETSRRLVMAGIGVVVVAGSEMKSFVSRLIESGELVKDDGRTSPAATAVAAPRRVGRRLQRPMNSLFARLNMPTKSDIDALNTQVSTLLEKIEALQQTEEQLASPVRPLLDTEVDTASDTDPASN